MHDLTGRKKIFLQVAVSILVLMFVSQIARLDAQAVGATLSGTVTDQSGGVIANAAVVIANKATGESRITSTNLDGIYSAPNLQPGNYIVTVTATGFSKAVQSGLTLTVGAAQTLNIALVVGQATQTVEVTTEAPIVNLTNAEIGALTNETTIKELPLNGRSWSSLATLQPGVYQIHTQPNVTSSDRVVRGFGAQLSISGNRPQQNNYRVDGVSINDPAEGGPGNVLGSNSGVDAIAEFSVLTTNFAAQYGRASGGVINATTKSGTNQFHGSAYEFLRNSYLDAPNYWDAKDSSGNYVKPSFRRNQFGASAGGPIIKNKTFIFGDYEGLRQAKGLSFASLVPDVTSTTVDPNVLPYLNAFFPVNGTLNGKTVCAISPGGGANANTCSFGANQVTSENYYIIRADHHISDRDSLSGTFFRDKSPLNTPDEFNNKTISTETSSIFATIAETHSFTANLNNSARFGFHRDVQGGPAGATAINPAAGDTSYGIIPTLDAPQIFIGGHSIFSGGLTTDKPALKHWNTYQFYDDAFWNKGKHSFGFGVSVERDQLNKSVSSKPGGVITYGSMAGFLGNLPAQITTDLPGLTRPEQTRQSIFGFYFQDDWRFRPNLTINLGLRYEPSTVPFDAQGRNATLLTLYDTTGTQLPVCGQKFMNASGVVTCNAQTDGLFRNNSLKNFDPRVGFAWDPQSNGKMSVRGGFGFYDQLPYIPMLGSTTDGSSVPFLQSGNASLVQGSFGQLTAFPTTCPPPPPPGGSYPAGTSAYCQLSVAGSNRVAFIEQNPKRSYVMQWNLNVQRELLPNLTAMIGYVGSHGVHLPTQQDDTNIVLPMASPMGYLWPCDNAKTGVQFTGGNSNDCPGLGSGTKLNQSFGRLPSTFFRDSSVYNGLELQLTKVMSHGIQVTTSFTYQKSLDTASGAVISDSVITGISSLNWFDPKLTRAVSDFNTGKIFTVNYLWEIPTPKSWSGFARGAAGGWQLGGIFSASTGEPFTPLMTGAGGDPLGLTSTDTFAYPDRLSGPGCQSLVNPGNVSNYIKLQCFQIPGVANFNGHNYIRLGSVGRNILTGPGLESLDFSVVKNTKISRISETFNVQFRLEIFNITNRVNFNPPVTNEVLFDVSTVSPGTVAVPGPTGPCPAGGGVASGCLGAAGALTGSDNTATDSRQMQLSLKVIW